MSGAALGLHHVEQVMGMAVSIDVRDVGVPREIIDEVLAWLHHVDETFSPYIPESPVSAIGRGDLAVEDASAEIRNVLGMCELMRYETDGVFDVFAVPAPNGTQFDPSGLVKGWAIEESARLIERHGGSNLCINAGGDIALRGHPQGEDPWRVGIRHPFSADSMALIVEAEGPMAVATSATYERGAHIVDPRTGLTALSLASVTIVGPDLTLADAYATAVFVMGIDGLDWISDRQGYEAYLVTNDARTLLSPGFGAYRARESDPQ